MDTTLNRRHFIQKTTAATVGMGLASPYISKSLAEPDKKIRIGMVGVGGRGTGLLGILLTMEGLEFPAICDINIDNLKKAQDLVEKAGHKRPEGYFRDEQSFQQLMFRDDLDAVVIASPWGWHTPMAVCGMKAGKYVAVEVPAALTFEQCWDLVRTHEETGMPCMMLENWSFRQDNLAVLNMIRQGLLGDIVHCHAAHSHDCIDHWFFDPQGNMRWGGKYLVERNCDQYPTHALGPVISWMNIGCGDYYSYVTSTATRSAGINAYFIRKFGPDHPNAKRKYAQGDIVSSVIKTQKGNTIVLNYDMQLPRPYDNRWQIQGTLGIYNEQRNAVYITGRSPKYHDWEPFPPYQDQFENFWWRAIKDKASEISHGGTDYLELQQFLKAVKNKTQTPIDVYDSVALSALIPLSQQSIANGSTPVQCPDFTGGKWKTKKPAFALEG